VSTGATRYTCPHGCGWHYDVPGPSAADLVGIAPDPRAETLADAIASISGRAALRIARATEQAVAEHMIGHLADHPDA
jgi:hypothetical protein